MINNREPIDEYKGDFVNILCVEALIITMLFACILANSLITTDAVGVFVLSLASSLLYVAACFALGALVSVHMSLRTMEARRKW